MSKHAESRAVEYSCRVYRRLLLVYPKSHREEYGVAILQIFRDQCRDAWSARRVRGVIGFWLRAIVDLLKASVLEHFSNFNWSRIMPISFRPTVKPLPAFFRICALVFLLIFSGSVLITTLVPERFSSTATILVARPLINHTSELDADWVAFETGTICSGAVLDEVAKKMDLQGLWRKRYNNGGPLRSADVVLLLKARVDISRALQDRTPVEMTDMAQLRVRAYSDDPAEAAWIANAVVESYRSLRLAQSHLADSSPVERRVTILDRAVPADQPVRPNKPLNFVIGALAGILAGVMVAPLILGIVTAIRKGRSTFILPAKA